MKRLMLITFSLLLLLCSCSSDDTQELSSEESSKSLFHGHKIAEKLDCDWIFLPDEAELIRTEEVHKELKANFTGCEFEEINAYAKELFSLMKDNGWDIFDATDLLKPIKLTEFKETKLDISFAGLAYRYYYINDEKVYMLSLHYYGSAGGKYGNGQSVVGICEVTATAGQLVKE